MKFRLQLVKSSIWIVIKENKNKNTILSDSLIGTEKIEGYTEC